MVEFDPDSNSDEDEEQVTYVIIKGDMRTKGLFIANYTQKWVDRCCRKTNHQRFNSKFGTSSVVLCTIYNGVQNQRQKIHL